MSPSPKSQVMFASAFSWISDFFVFLGFIFLSYGEFVELINMHAMKLRVQALRAALASGARGALPLVGWVSYNCWVSLRDRHATMQVMLGVSLQARWDATLVSLIQSHVSFSLMFQFQPLISLIQLFWNRNFPWCSDVFRSMWLEYSV